MIVDKSTFKELLKVDRSLSSSINHMAFFMYGYKDIKSGVNMNIYIKNNGIFCDVVFGKKIYIDYNNVNDVEINEKDFIITVNENGQDNKLVIRFVKSNIEKIFNTIRQNANLDYKEIKKSSDGINIQQPLTMKEIREQRTKNNNGGMTCPRCGSHRIQIINNDANMKSSTSLNLNPLKPFTMFNHKKKAKVSKAKVGAAILTGGASLMFTGVKNNKHLEVFCTECGHRWQMK